MKATKFVPDSKAKPKKPKVVRLKQVHPGEGLIFLCDGLTLDQALAKDDAMPVYMMLDVPSKEGRYTIIGIDGKGMRVVEGDHLVTKHNLRVSVEEAELV